MHSLSLSIIICSIKPELVRQTCENIRATAGVDLEFHVIDNRKDNRSIAQVYNEGARLSKSPYLLFIHEDVLFKSSGWGKLLTDKLSEPDCGVIGLAGGTFWTPTARSWADVCRRTYRKFRIFQITDGEETLYAHPHNESRDFVPVVTLDGVAMAVRRDVWEKYPFDEEILTSFHFYDMDFTQTIARHYTNYVCYKIDLIHFSHGSFDRKWYEVWQYVYENKWKNLEPVSVGDMPENIATIEEFQTYKAAFRLIRSRCNKSEGRKIIKNYIKEAPSGSGISKCKHLLGLCWQYVLKCK